MSEHEPAEDERPADQLPEGDEPEQEPQVVEPDHPDTINALRDIGARLELNANGCIWRVFFYDRNTDEDLAHIHGLHALKEIWLLGSKVTPSGAAELRERLPNVKVYS